MSVARQQDKPIRASSPTLHRYPLWAPRFWHGMRTRDWLRLLAENRFRIHPFRWPMATSISLVSPVNSVLARIQRLTHGKRIREATIHESPLFILGHWRSGTTYLHELLSRDDQFISPSTYQCFAPHHFLLTQSVIPRLLWFIIPSQRPMDNVKVGWSQPQEDEFGVCIMGVPSPYLRLAFPNRADARLDYLNMRGLSKVEIEQWLEGFRTFLRLLSTGREQPLLLKSPTHTGRIGLLAKEFPKAKFVHIVRHPFDLVSSSIRLWHALDTTQGLQIPNFNSLEDYIMQAYHSMYEGFESGRREVSPDRLITVRYDDVVRDPVSEVARIYEQLGLTGYESLEPTLANIAEQSKSYQAGKHRLDDRLKGRVVEEWAAYFENYGYPTQ